MKLYVTKSFMLETIRNYGVFIGNLLTPFLFILVSWICTLGMKSDSTSLDFIIKGQFFPISIMLLVFSFAFTSATIYLAELKSTKAFQWLKRTNISPNSYFVGMGIGVFLLMNVALLLLLIGYALLIPITLKSAISILLICNFVLLALYPLCFIVAGFVKNGKTAQSMLTPIMLIFLFSITMPSLFLTLAGKNPQDYYVFLAWNPMLYLNDTMQFQLSLIDQTWLPLYQYIVILAIVSALLSLTAKKTFMR